MTDLRKVVLAAVEHSKHEPEHVVSVYQIRPTACGRYTWAGIRFDESRARIEEGKHVSVLYRSFKNGEEIAI